MARAAFLFQRSLRLDDNLGLLAAITGSGADGSAGKASVSVLPVFCVDTRQAVRANNSYFSGKALGFMRTTLQELEEDLRKNTKTAVDGDAKGLLMVYGEAHVVVPQALQARGITRLYINEDYTPFARKRATDLRDAMAKFGGTVVEVPDLLLYGPIGSVLSTSGKAFKVYTPFSNFLTTSRRIDTVPQPQPFPRDTATFLSSKPVNAAEAEMSAKAWKCLDANAEALLPVDVVVEGKPTTQPPGGRRQGVAALAGLPITQNDYAKCRDYFTYKTTHLSPHLKFGTVSCREAWHATSAMPNEDSKGRVRDQLIWREFYYHYYACYPEELEWDRAAKPLELVKPHPLVEACRNELERTGDLHNRGRMLLATHVMHIQKAYWKDGDAFFAQRLTDYDPLLNVGNWKWIEKRPPFKQIQPKTQTKWDVACPMKHLPVPLSMPKSGGYMEHWLTGEGAKTGQRPVWIDEQGAEVALTPLSRTTVTRSSAVPAPAERAVDSGKARPRTANKKRRVQDERY